MKCKRSLLSCAVLTMLLLGGHTPTPLQRQDLQRDLTALTKRGFTYRMLDNDLIEVMDPVNGEKRLKNLREASEPTIRAWAAQRSIPMLEIDPNTIDTSQYNGWFNYWSRLPVSTDPGQGEPPIVGDVNRNGKTDVYGLYWDSGTAQKTYAYEVDTNGAVSFLHDYSPILRIPIGLIDADRDSLVELSLLNFGDSTLYFEQPSLTLPPVNFQFGHRHIEGGLGVGYTHIVYTHIDGDSLIDLLYKGSERDSVDTTQYREKVFVAEYKPQVNNFVRVWSTDFSRDAPWIGGFAVNDFDGDGRTEFAACDLIHGRVYVTENVGNDSFAVTWKDSVPFNNVYYGGSGDVDHDGLPEFFVGATISNGDWFTMFEADSNDHYSAKFLIHLLSGGTFDNPQILTNDIENDGRPELVICAGADIYVFKSNLDNSYYLWYLKRENARDGIQFHDFNKDGRKDIIVGKTIYVDPPGYFRSFSDIYVATSLVSVDDQSSVGISDRFLLLSNYPNPFNPNTTIEYYLKNQDRVILRIYNLLGQLIATLVNEEQSEGRHAIVWEPADMASGVYICRLEVTGSSLTKKLILIR
jgi:hypothetical protein